MKKIRIQILLLALATTARAQTPLTVGLVDTNQPSLCWNSTAPVVQLNNAAFTISGVSGIGYVSSSVQQNPDEPFVPMPYTYTLDLSQMGTNLSDLSHCIRLQIHFGAPVDCVYDVVQAIQWTNLLVVGATTTPYGDITLTFNENSTNSGPCMYPGPIGLASFIIASDTRPILGHVTVIDDYIDPNTQQITESTYNVPAYVPSVPAVPNTVGICPSCSQAVSEFTMQGVLSQASVPVASGPWDFVFTFRDGPSNNFVVGPPITKTLTVGPNGLFTACIPQQTAFLSPLPSYVSLAVRPSGVGSYTQLSPPFQIKPVPQAFYSLSAGTVAALDPGQAVLNINGQSGNLTLRAGLNSSILQSNGTFTFNAFAAGSDRNTKTDISPVKSADILAELAKLSIQSWRYTNETAGIRHLGPMAQDFKAAFNLGDDDRIIPLIDEGGVALVAIQGLNQKVDRLGQELQQRDTENAELKNEISALRQCLQELSAKPRK
jgi:hypothetical protein